MHHESVHVDMFEKGFKFKSKGCVALFPLPAHTTSWKRLVAYLCRAVMSKFYSYSLFLSLIFAEAGGTDETIAHFLDLA